MAQPAEQKPMGRFFGMISSVGSDFSLPHITRQYQIDNWVEDGLQLHSSRRHMLMPKEVWTVVALCAKVPSRVCMHHSYT